MLSYDNAAVARIRALFKFKHEILCIAEYCCIGSLPSLAMNIYPVYIQSLISPDISVPITFDIDSFEHHCA